MEQQEPPGEGLIWTSEGGDSLASPETPTPGPWTSYGRRGGRPLSRGGPPGAEGLEVLPGRPSCLPGRARPPRAGRRAGHPRAPLPPKPWAAPELTGRTGRLLGPRGRRRGPSDRGPPPSRRRRRPSCNRTPVGGGGCPTWKGEAGGASGPSPYSRPPRGGREESGREAAPSSTQRGPRSPLSAAASSEGEAGSLAGGAGALAGSEEARHPRGFPRAVPDQGRPGPEWGGPCRDGASPAASSARLKSRSAEQRGRGGGGRGSRRLHSAFARRTDRPARPWPSPRPGPPLPHSAP